MVFRSLKCSDLLPSQEWNEKLALLAEERASSCQPDFPSSNSTSLSLVGWNTNISAVGAASFSDVVDGWFAEGRDFAYLSGKCRESATCQHYTQVFTSRCIKHAYLSAHVLCVCVRVCVSERERESSSVLSCSWCGPHRVTWAVPSSCVREGETSGRCSSARTPPGNCNTHFPHLRAPHSPNRKSQV